MLKAFFKAATAFFRAVPLFAASQLNKQADDLEDEIYSLGLDGSPTSKLRIEQLARRRGRILEQIRFIRPADPDSR